MNEPTPETGARAGSSAFDPHDQQLVELSPLAIAVHSGGCLLYANPACLALFGVPSHDVIVGKPILDFVHPDSHAAVRARVAQVYQQGQASPLVEERMRRLNGEAFDAAVAVAPLRVDGQAAAQVVIQDITLRKKAERALAESEQKFRAMAETCPSVIFLRRGREVLYANPRASQLLGYSREEFYAPDFNFMCVIAPDSVGPVVDALTRRERGLEVEPYVCTLQTKHGQHLRAVLASANIELQGQRAILGVVTDVTASQRAEQDLRELNQGLERRLAERTAQLQAVNSELEAFVYSVSHDLRSPLHHINGFAEALQDEFGPALGVQGLHYLTRLRQGVEQMSGLIDDLLRLSRLSRAELQRIDIDLSALCRVIVGELLTSEPGRQISIDIEDGLRVRADANLLRVVLENLLGNALKFTRLTTEPRVQVGSQRGADVEGSGDDDARVFFVRDNGAGFDMKQADRLFTPFQRLHRQSDYPGHGVGLATAQRIVARHGGRIWAHSAPDQGATFYFTLLAPTVETA